MKNEPIKKSSFINIFKAFLKIGMILLGGGYVIIPIMKNELIEKRNWLSEDELCDYYCVSQCLPGIIAINMSVLVGYKLSKIKGVLAAVFGMSFSPFIAIVIIANLLTKIMQISFMEGLFFGINLSVIVLIYLTIREIWKKSIIDYFSAFWFSFMLILAVFKVSPVILILLSISCGLLAEFKKKRQG